MKRVDTNPEVLLSQQEQSNDLKLHQAGGFGYDATGVIVHGGNCRMRVHVPLRIITQTSLALPDPRHFRRVNSLDKSAIEDRFNTTALKALTTLKASAPTGSYNGTS